MKQIKNFNVPESWKDVTINQLIEFQSINFEGISTKAVCKIVEVFNKDKDASDLPLEDLYDIASAIYQLMTTQPEVNDGVDTYILDGVEYKVANVDEIDFQTFIDVNALKTEDQTEQIKNLPLIISVVTEDKPMDGREFADLIASKMDILTATSVVVFFSKILANYITDFLLYSNNSNQPTQTTSNQKNTL